MYGKNFVKIYSRCREAATSPSTVELLKRYLSLAYGGGDANHKARRTPCTCRRYCMGQASVVISFVFPFFWNFSNRTQETVAQKKHNTRKPMQCSFDVRF